MQNDQATTRGAVAGADAPAVSSPQVAPGPVTITTIGQDGQPVTITTLRDQEEVDAIVARVRGLESQVSDLAARRSQLVSQITEAPEGVARTGLEERVRLLDGQIARIDADLAAANAVLTTAPTHLVQWAERENYSRSDDGFEAGFFVGGFTVLAPVLLYAGWRRFRRKRRPVRTDDLQVAPAGRLEHLERGMEAIAVEIERISEGQRFVTRLLSETRDAQPIPAKSVEKTQ